MAAPPPRSGPAGARPGRPAAMPAEHGFSPDRHIRFWPYGVKDLGPSHGALGGRAVRRAVLREVTPAAVAAAHAAALNEIAGRPRLRGHRRPDPRSS